MSLLFRPADDSGEVLEILERRALTENYGGRRLEDEEVVMASLVDQHGYVQKLADLMMVATRLEKVSNFYYIIYQKLWRIFDRLIIDVFFWNLLKIIYRKKKQKILLNLVDIVYFVDG
jgi:hypothetical protein